MLEALPERAAPISAVSLKEAAKRLRVCTKTVSNWLAAHRLRRISGTSRVLIPEAELQRFLRENLQ